MGKEKILTDLNKAIAEFNDALSTPAQSNLIKAGCIQYFEFCFELAWKTIKIISAEQGIDCQSPKSCLKQAYQAGWINNENVWLDMLNTRNRMSHTYDSQSALGIYQNLPLYCKEIQSLYHTLSVLKD